MHATDHYSKSKSYKNVFKPYDFWVNLVYLNYFHQKHLIEKTILFYRLDVDGYCWRVGSGEVFEDFTNT